MYEDSHTRMAKVEYADMIKTCSGALKKINKKSPHAMDEKMVLTTHRVAATTTKNGCSRIYLRNLANVTRTTLPSANELLIRNRFSAVSKAVALRKNDLSQITDDQIAFEAQKNQPGGKKTMLAYLWSLEGATYDQAHPRS